MYVANIAALKALSTGGGVHVMGYVTHGDGGGGYFVFDSSSAVAADDGMVIAPASGSGRWFRVRENSAVYVDWFGPNHTAAFVAASAYPHVILSNKTYSMDTTIAIKAGQLWDFNGATVTHTDDTKVMFTATNVDGWMMRGPGTLKGTLTTSGFMPEKGLVVSGCNKYRVSCLTALLFKNAGFHVMAGTFTGAKADQGQWSDCAAYECMIGFLADGDSAAEYNTVSNFNASWNVTGLKIGAGNTIFIGGTIGQNNVGVVLTGDYSNNGHGIFSGANINHNAINIRATNITQGYTFSGCHIYGDGPASDPSAAAGRVILEGTTTDINFVGGVLDAAIINDSGTNRVSHTKKYAQFVVAGALPAQLIQADDF